MGRRIFIAVPAPVVITEYLLKLKEANPDLSAIKWTETSNLHLTLYFIGNVSQEGFDAVVEVLSHIREQCEFTIEFEDICLAPLKKPRMIWAKFHRHTSFTQLYHSIHESLKTIRQENKHPYTDPIPHITLGRFKTTKKPENFNFISPPGLKELKITSCQLWESIPSPAGVRYEKILDGY